MENGSLGPQISVMYGYQQLFFPYFSALKFAAKRFYRGTAPTETKSRDTQIVRTFPTKAGDSKVVAHGSCDINPSPNLPVILFLKIFLSLHIFLSAAPLDCKLLKDLSPTHL